ncbi:MAG: response regulator transcription factor [Nakamurella sp.]
MAQVMVVEDDDTIGRGLVSSLTAHGHTAFRATTGAEALSEGTTRQFDLALLDLGLPDMDGIDVCRRLRRLQPGCVLVVLTARHEEIDVVFGLEAGADDYLTKPFRLAELLARIEAHLRRGPAGPVPPTPTTPTAGTGMLRVDLAARRALLGDVEIPLRTKEFDLLARLVAEPGVAVARATLMSDVWDENWFGSTKTLDVHIAALRRKLAAAAAHGGLPAPEIVTLRAHGFRLEGR